MATETSPLHGAEEGGLGGFICCRALAPVSFPFTEKNRQTVLYAAHCLCGLGVFLSIVAYVGAFAYGNTLSYLSWVTAHGPRGVSHAGVRWVCYDVPYDPRKTGPGGFLQEPQQYWKCESWQTFDCSKRASEHVNDCSACQSSSIGISMAVVISVITYLLFYKKTNARLNGDDSNFVKFMACFSALVGGTNFLLAVVAYWNSCVVTVGASNPGVGLIFVSIAAALKVFMGFLHLGLPVERSTKDAAS